LKYEEFVANVRERIEKREGEEVRIHISKIIHNNGSATDSICLLSNGENISPAISLEPFYQMARRGTSLDEIVSQILSYHNRYRRKKGMDVSFFTDYSRAREQIVCKLIHFEKNAELLSHIPNRRFLDLAVVYYYLVEEPTFQGGTILIQDSHLEMWNISLRELHDCALQNTARLLPYEFITMAGMIEQMTGMRMFSDDDEPAMYVLTNKQKTYGAVYMLYGDVLEEIAEKIGEDYYLLPGSVHECILIPTSAAADETELQKMVQEINETQVAEEELLSNSVYQYSRSGKCLCIACDGN
jgi:hypothetical protein